MVMPQQKPGQSKQDYRTPKELLTAVKKRLGIPQFAIDVAADKQNAVCETYYDESRSALDDHNHWYLKSGGWAWCNPPYANINSWVQKAAYESLNYNAQTVMLIPASVGANWWRDHVENNAYVLFLNGRLTFQGCDAPYPKDCALLLYVPWRATGNQVWNWREAL